MFELVSDHQSGVVNDVFCDDGKTPFSKQLRWRIHAHEQIVGYVVITPEMAEEMLKYNSVEGLPNRPCTRQTVTKYGRLMKDGLWGHEGRGTSEPIIFSDRHRLLSGQHRLEAVIAAGVPQRFMVVFGEPDENFAFIDQGRRRTNQDIFAMYQIPNYSVIAAATRWIQSYDQQALGGAAVDSSPEELYQFFLTLPRLQESVPYGRQFAEAKLAAQSVMTAMHFICARKNRALANAFFDQVASGLGFTNKKSAAYVLRRTLDDNARSTAKLSPTLIAAYTIKAWNAERAGRSVGLLKWRTGQSPNEPFPRAH